MKGPFLLLLDYVLEDTDVFILLNLDSKCLLWVVALHPAVELDRACHFVDESEIAAASQMQGEDSEWSRTNHIK